MEGQDWVLPNGCHPGGHIPGVPFRSFPGCRKALHLSSGGHGHGTDRRLPCRVDGWRDCSGCLPGPCGLRQGGLRASYGIEIRPEQWLSCGIAGGIITDKGREFCGQRMDELCVRYGVEWESVPPFRPDNKGLVEKTFDLIQQRYKATLRGKGVIESDAMELVFSNRLFGAPCFPNINIA